MFQDLELKLRLTLEKGRFKVGLSDTSRQIRSLGPDAERAGRQMDAGFGNARRGAESISRQLSAVRNQVIGFFSIQFAAGLTASLIEQADSIRSLDARLRLATGSAFEFATVQNELFDLAQRSRAPLEETVRLYTRLAPSIRNAGGAQQDALDITELTTQAIKLSGATAQETQSAILQFGQALRSGVLQGDEFRSLAENSTRLLQAIADGIDEPIGKLKKMASEGELTTEVIIEALLTQKERLAAEFSALPPLVSDALTNIETQFIGYVRAFDQANDVTGQLAGTLQSAADNFDEIITVTTLLAELVGVRLVTALGQFGVAQAARLAATRAQIVSDRLAAAQTLRNAQLEQAAATAALLSAQRRQAANLASAASLRAVEVAQEKVTAATVASTAATTAYTAAVGRANIAARAFGGAMALLGGPAGVVLLAATALIAFSDKAETAEQRMARLTGEVDDFKRSLDALSTQNIQREIQAQSDEIDRLIVRLRDLKRQQESSATFAGFQSFKQQIGETADALAIANEKLEALRGQEAINIAEKLDFSNLKKDKIASLIGEVTEQLNEARSAFEEARNKFKSGLISRGDLDDSAAEVTRLKEKLNALEEAVNRLDGRDVRVNVSVEVQGSIDALERQLEAEQRLNSARTQGAGAVSRTKALIESENQIRKLGIDAASEQAEKIRSLNLALAEQDRISRRLSASRRRSAPGRRSGGRANDAARILRAETAAALAEFSAGLDRQKADLDRMLDDSLISYRAFYQQQAELDRAAIDKRIESARQFIAATDSRADTIRLTAEINRLEQQRGDIAVAASRKQQEAERRLADQLSAVRLQVKELTGTATAGDLFASVQQRYSELLARLSAESDTAGVAIVNRLINLQAADRQFDALEERFNAALEAVRNAEQRINIERESGLLTQTQAQQKIIDLHHETSAAVRVLIENMVRLAEASGNPELVNAAAQMANQFKQLELTSESSVDAITKQWDDATGQIKKASIGWAQDATAAFVEFARTGKLEFSSLVDSIIADLLRITIQKAVIGPLEKTLFGTGGLLDIASAAISAPAAHTGAIIGKEQSFRRTLPAAAL